MAAALGLTACVAAGMAGAASLEWQDNSLTYVGGGHFKVAPESQQTITYEHVSGWSFGDVFMFVDATQYNGDRGESYYGEFSPRFSYGKLSGTGMGSGLVKDALLTTTLEFGKGHVESFLAGPAIDLNLPGFDYFQLNFYRRFPLCGQDGKTVQVTPVWGMTLPGAGGRWKFDGFMDWNVNSDGSYASNWHFNPQFKYDLGRSFGMKDRALLVGVEYSYWKNKYGIRDSGEFRTDESAISAIVKSHF
jgi:nucleoside-specific outer membrane channel protein Tsx